MKTVIIFALHLLFISIISAQDKGNLTVTFEDFENPKGEIYIAVFQKENFLRKPTETSMLKVKAEDNQVTFEDLPHGEYAVSVFHDLNGNQAFDMDDYGRPQEPWSMSGSANPMQAPIWDDTKFEFNTSEKNIALKLFN